MEQRKYLTVREAADVARLSPYRIRQLLRERRFNGVRPGGRGFWRIPTEAVSEYLGERSEARA